MLNFIKRFSCICWDEYIVFIPQLINVVCHIDWFANIKISLHHWDKSHLIMVYDPFTVLLDSVCWYWRFLHLCSSVILACNSLFCDIFVWFWYQVVGGFLEWAWEYSSLCNFLEEFQKDIFLPSSVLMVVPF